MSEMSEPPEGEQILAKGRRYTLVEITDHYTMWEDVRFPHFPDVYYANKTGREVVAWDEVDLEQRFQEWSRRMSPRPELLDWLRSLTYEPDEVDAIKQCVRCNRPEHEDDAMSTAEGFVCEPCSEDFAYCGGCDVMHHDTLLTYITDEQARCSSCLNANWWFCGDCDTYVHNEDGHSHEEDADEGCCEAPGQQFTIRNDGLPALANDTRITVGLGAGEISDVGIEAISEAIRGWARDNITDDARYTDEARHSYTPEYLGYWELARDLSPLGVKWQQKDGNWTKRFSRFAYKTRSLKVSPALVSTIGNIASEHSQGADYHIEVTRDLNLSAREFGHSDSCWWQSYSEGRCALKSNGGFGLRAFDDDRVAGRAWVLPLMGLTGESGTRRLKRDGLVSCSGDCCWDVVPGEGSVPTFDAMSADGFVVFNGYGKLSGYAPARILAHMAGMTYRKIEFTCIPMYVNNNSGYLVAPEEIAQKYTDSRINIVVDQHADLYRREQTSHIESTTEQRETVDA